MFFLCSLSRRCSHGTPTAQPLLSLLLDLIRPRPDCLPLRFKKAQWQILLQKACIPWQLGPQSCRCRGILSKRIVLFFAPRKSVVSPQLLTWPLCHCRRVSHHDRHGMCALRKEHREECLGLHKKRVGVESSWSSLQPDTECPWKRTIPSARPLSKLAHI